MPMTVKGIFLIRMLLPIGSALPKRFSATVWPIRQFLVAPSTSDWETFLPAASGQSLTVSISGVVPMTMVDQF